MKRVFTLFCALVLLLSSLSGLAVSATTEDGALVPEVAVTEPVEAPAEESAEAPAEEPAAEPVEEPAEAPSEEPEDEILEVEPVTIEDGMIVSDGVSISTYGALPLENQLGKNFINYVQPYIANCATEIPISQFNIHVNNFDAVCNIIFYEAPELFSPQTLGGTYNSSTGMLTTLKVKSYQTYSDTPAEYSAYLKKMREGAAYLLRGLENNNSLTDVQKALILHDRLAAWTEYDLAFSKKEIYAAVGPLANQSGVCQGYALAYSYLLEHVGIESDLCLSDALNHAWNIVYIAGVPYYTDVTWDDPVNGWNSDKTLLYDDYGRVKHTNFLRSYAGIRETGHTASDYQVVSAGTTYDSGWWWMDSYTAVEYVGGTLYHLDYNNGKIYQLNQAENRWYSIYATGVTGKTPKMASAGTKLLYNDSYYIYLLDPATGARTTLFDVNSSYYGGYLEGMKYENGYVHYQVRYNGRSYRNSFYYLDASSVVSITKQPQDAMAGNGKTVTTTVEATGDGLTYVWYFKNAGAAEYSLSSTTTNTYSTVMNAAKNGRTVYCVITDAYGNHVTSDVATLRMGNVATITGQPSNAAAPIGKNVTTKVTATGDGLTYAWYYKDITDAEFLQSPSISNTYTAVMTDAVNGRQVYCVVTDQYGNFVVSNVATLFVGNTLKITTQPKNVTVGIGKTVKIPLKATGDGLTYTWYFKDTNKSTYSVSSVTTNTYTTTMKANAAGRKVYCIVTDQYGGTVKSNVVTITKGNLAKITTQPTNMVAANGKTVKVTVKASGDGLTYTWYYAKKGSNSFTKATTTGATYSVKMSSSVNGRKVYCVVKDKYGTTVKSNVVTLYKGTPAKFTQQPVNTKMPAGMKISVTVKASGSGLKYAWYFKNKGATSFSKSSVTTKTYSVTMKDSVAGRQVYCVITDKYGMPTKSNVVTLSLAPTLKITKQPTSAVVTSGSTAKVSVSASGDGLTYTWYYAKSGSSSFKKASGKSNTYSVKMSSSVSGRKVYCIVKDKYGASVKTNVVTLTDPIKLIVGSWKGDYQKTNSGYWYDISHITMKITTEKKVTIKVPYSGSGYNSGTFTYKLTYLNKSGDVITYRLKNTNSSETLYLYYIISSKTLALEVGNVTQYYYK